jgi:hypothetical protein
MRAINKYRLEPGNGVTTLKMPVGAEILTVQVQRELPVLWALVERTNDTVERTFVTVPTGPRLPSEVASMLQGRSYIGTYQMASGDYVGHVFELL